MAELREWKRKGSLFMVELECKEEGLSILTGEHYDIYMDEKMVNGIKKLSPCDVEALKKCLDENKGDYLKCQSQIEAFKSSCSLKKPPSSQASS